MEEGVLSPFHGVQSLASHSSVYGGPSKVQTRDGERCGVRWHFKLES